MCVSFNKILTNCTSGESSINVVCNKNIVYLVSFPVGKC